MSKQVQIPEELFDELLYYFFEDINEDSFIRIRSALSDKVDKLIARSLFTDYKTSTLAEREIARQRYLDHVGVKRDWRTDTEVPKSKLA